MLFRSSGQGAYAISNHHQAAPGSANLLVVDDEDILCRVMARLLSRAGFQVWATSDPRQALSMGTGRDTPFDLLITDVLMPDLNGAELAKSLLEAGKVANVLFVSGFTGHITLLDELIAGGASFLEKPFGASELVEKARAILRR